MKAGEWPGAGVCVADSHSSRFAGIIFKPHTALSRGCFPVLERYSIVFQLSRLHVALKKKCQLNLTLLPLIELILTLKGIKIYLY